MLLRFTKTCKDKYTEQMYYLNSTHEFEEERGNEIVATGFAEIVEEPKKEPTEEKEQEAETNYEEALKAGKVVNLYDLKLEDIKKIARKEGVAVRGTKDEIIERIMKAHEND